MHMLLIALLFTGTSADDGAASCPMHAQHQAEAERKAHVERRGDAVMGFSHAATTHHFTLLRDGGSIEVTANDAKDEASTRAIREHLTRVAEAFAKADFDMPHRVHAMDPPGVEALKTLKAEVSWRYEPVAGGGRVLVSTKSPEALRAIHEFLRFQIEDHHTGDSKELANR